MYFLPRKDIFEMELPSARACVKVRVKKGKGKSVDLVLIPGSGIGILPEGTLMTSLPDYVRVVTPDGEVLQPTGKFYATVETIDPFHAVVDLF